MLIINFSSILVEMSQKRSTPRGKNQFNEDWLKKYEWVKKKSSSHVTCTYCNTDLNFTNMGESALSKHEKPNPTNPTKHQRQAAEKQKSRRNLSVLNFIASQDQSQDQTASQSSSTQPTLDQYVLPISVAEAEIRWVMKVVWNHQSMRSCDGLDELFPKSNWFQRSTHRLSSLCCLTRV